MLLKIYHHLHPVVEFESEFVEQIVYTYVNEVFLFPLRLIHL
jgi:hypothetical protein